MQPNRNNNSKGFHYPNGSSIGGQPNPTSGSYQHSNNIPSPYGQNFGPSNPPRHHSIQGTPQVSSGYPQPPSKGPPISNSAQSFPSRGPPTPVSSHQFQGRPQLMTGRGPPQQFQGRPQSIPARGPPQQFQGRPQSIPARGPPPQFQGRPQNIPGHSQQFIGKPQTISGPPQTIPGRGPPMPRPPEQFYGRPQAMQGPPQSFPNSPRFGGPPPPKYPNPPVSSQQNPSYGQPRGPPTPQPQQYRGPRQQSNSDPRQRIDPNQIPRPPPQTEIIRYHARGHTMTQPPPASSDYIAYDEGCCNPRYIRPTLNHIPCTKEIARQSGIPIAMIISPLAIPHKEEYEVPLIDFGPEGPLRCNRCKAYICTFTKFIQGGRKYICNICEMQNETPREYYCNVDEYGNRRDVQQRPELSKGSVEFIVPSAYTIRPIQIPIFVFVIDVSSFSIKSGLLDAALKTLKETLLNSTDSGRTKVGIVTFDRNVQYYSMENNVSMHVCPDIDDPCSPLPHKAWLGTLKDSREHIDRICEVILKMFENSEITEGAVGSALYSVADALSISGGRIILFQAALPKIGVGKITREESKKFYGTDKERPMYTPDEKDNFYKDLAQSCAKRQIGVDMFICGQTYSDIATVGQVCKSTGGSVHYAPHFGKNLVEDVARLQRELERAMYHTNGFEAVLKVRCSRGLRVKDHYGHFSNQFGTDIEIAVVDSDKSIIVVLEHEDDLTEGNDVYIQAALLYSTKDGNRCVRVHNLALQVAPLLANVFRYADLEAICGLYQRIAVQRMFEKNSIQTKNEIVMFCVNVLYNYRKHCAAASSSGQLILPESLKLLPLYILSIIKSMAIRCNSMASATRGVIDVNADERSVMLMLLDSIPAEHAVSAVYPKLYAIHSMPKNCGTIRSEDGHVIFPDSLPPTSEKLSEDGIFLLASSVSLQLYVAPLADPNLITDLFGVAQINTAEQVVNIISNGSENSLADRVTTIVNEIRRNSPVQQTLDIITKNDWRSTQFLNNLVEDRTKNDLSYVEFLCDIHKKIQARIL